MDTVRTDQHPQPNLPYKELSIDIFNKQFLIKKNYFDIKLKPN